MAFKIELDEDGVSITGDNQKDIKAMNEPENLETISKIAKTFFKSRNEEQLEYEKKSAEIENPKNKQETIHVTSVIQYHNGASTNVKRLKEIFKL